MKKKNIFFILLLLLLFCFIYFIFFRTRVSQNKETATNPTTVNEIKREDIVKCQNVVVTPQITTELFTYVSGKKIRLDYRMSATTEEKTGNHQVFYDGVWLYIWDRGVNDIEAVNGLKKRVVTFTINEDVGTLGKVETFKSGQMSGDRMCNTWDDVDPVFEVPKNVTFTEAIDTEKIWREQLDAICTICGTVPDEEKPSICQKNLSCTL
ncbi:MAG: hypothetical protein AAB937_00535 [Patescibacteria group bacterium]